MVSGGVSLAVAIIENRKSKAIYSDIHLNLNAMEN